MYLGLLDSFNGVNLLQTHNHVSISCCTYIECVLYTHGWSTMEHRHPESSKISPLHSDCLVQLYKDVGPSEGTPEHSALAEDQGFSFCTVLGKLLYAYVTCRPDIGYAVTMLSKFSMAPAHIHYQQLKNVAHYLCQTIDWGIVYHKTVPTASLPASQHVPLASESNLPPFPSPSTPDQLLCFVNAAHANDLCNHHSMTGYAFTMCGGAVSYCTKTQSITATSSTEAEFLAAVLAAKHAKYLHAILKELGFPQHEPTPIYEDNMSAIKMINARIPTEHSHHINIQHFAIQDWKDDNVIVLYFIPGIINPLDDLTKPLGWVLHSCHAHHLMGHY